TGPLRRLRLRATGGLRRPVARLRYACLWSSCRRAGARHPNLPSGPDRLGQLRQVVNHQGEAMAQYLLRSLLLPHVLQQTHQLGAGLDIPAVGEAGFQVLPGLAPEFIAQRQATERQQQGGVMCVIGEPALGAAQLASRVGAADQPIDMYQPVVVETGQGLAQYLSRMSLGSCGALSRAVGSERTNILSERFAQTLPVAADWIGRTCIQPVGPLPRLDQQGAVDPALQLQFVGFAVQVMAAQFRQ